VDDLDEYRREEWWRNDTEGSVTHRLTHPERPDLFVKRGPALGREHLRLLWCQARLPVPRLVEFTPGEVDVLITEALVGSAASDRRANPDTALVAQLLADAWRLVHTLPVDACPFDTSTDALLQAAEHAVATASYDVWDDDLDMMRPAADVLDELMTARPPKPERVVVHGDACLPNVLIDGDRVTGFVDLGFLGVGDAWWDVATCLTSMRRPGNAIAHACERFIDAYGVTYDPDIDRWYRLLYRLDPQLD
jgi:aminoglycoside phosphotransferase